MTYDAVRQQLLLAVEHPLAEAWSRQAYEGTEFAEWLDVPEAGAASIPAEVLDQAMQLTADLPEDERSRLVTWFIVRMVGSVAAIGPEDIEFDDDAEQRAERAPSPCRSLPSRGGTLRPPGGVVMACGHFGC